MNIFELDSFDNAEISSDNDSQKDVNLSFPTGKLLDDALGKLSWNTRFKHLTKVALYLLF